MKYIISLIIGASLTVSGFSQTRNVLVDTNSRVVQPTNFWSVDASNARSGLSLGTAATSSISAFQPSSSNLTNLSSNNAELLTNLASSNIVGILTISQGGTGSTNASNARTALGLGTSATNNSEAFQPSSLVLTNLSSSNGGLLTNIQASNIVGSINISNISSFNFTNIAGVLTVDKGGTSATNASDARANLGATTIGNSIFIATNAGSVRSTIGATTIGENLFTLANPSAIKFLRINADNTASSLTAFDFRAAIGLDSAATNSSSAFQPSSSVLTNLASSNAINLSNINSANIVGIVALASNVTETVALSSNVSGVISIINGGTGATNSATARTNLGLGTAATSSITLFQPSSSVLTNLANNNGSSLTNLTASSISGILLTNGNAFGLTNFPTNMSFGVYSPVGAYASKQFSNLPVRFGEPTIKGAWALYSEYDGSPKLSLAYALTPLNSNPTLSDLLVIRSNTFTFAGSLSINNSTNIAITRTNLNLGWGALTNSNIATQLLGYYDTNPYYPHVVIGTTDGDPITFTNEVDFIGQVQARITGSLLIVDGETNGISFETQSDSAYARTNLGIGATWLTNTNVTNFRSSIGLGNTNEVIFKRVEVEDFQITGTNLVSIPSLIVLSGIQFDDFTIASETRTNLSIPLPALTNTSNVTMMRELSGSTNTNEPYSGSVSLTNTNTLVFSNGILLRIQ